MATTLPTSVDLELYQPGDEVPYGGQYAIVDITGEQQDFDSIFLDEGDVFPELTQNTLNYILVESDISGQTGHSLMVAGPALDVAPPSEDLI